MPLWTLNTPPTWFSSAIVSESGWINPLTDEILVAINNLIARSTYGISAVYLPLNEGSGSVLHDISGHNRTSYVTDIAGSVLVDDVIWNNNPTSLQIIQDTQFGTCFDIGPFNKQLFIVTWVNRNSSFLTDWPNATLDGGGFYPQNYVVSDPISFDLFSRTIVTSGGHFVHSYYTWTDGTDSCTYVFSRPSTFQKWQFSCVGWDFETGECVSITNLIQDTPLSITGTTGIP